MKLVFATNNIHKLKEVQAILPEHIRLLSLKDISCTEKIEETATTLIGNAKLKADHIAKKYNCNCFADDTGLEVESLEGKPGVYSARYSGKYGDSERNMLKVLSELDGKSNRKAQFRTVIALHIKGQDYFFEGICKGVVQENKTGKDGFGYDPIFRPEGYSVSFAEMSTEEKNKISHPLD
ncbi:MAG: non-canonical purine NTP diphosphatase [Flavobacteriaceae bacterium]|nr:MAG: non-canonical purine NTP diphosphatase [Flavobacteriaceae bacterium]